MWKKNYFGWENAWTWHAFHSSEFEKGLGTNKTFQIGNSMFSLRETPLPKLHICTKSVFDSKSEAFTRRVLKRERLHFFSIFFALLVTRYQTEKHLTTIYKVLSCLRGDRL